MKVKIIKEEGGLVSVFVKRTLPKENPSRAVQHVAPEEVDAVIEKLVAEMTPPS